MKKTGYCFTAIIFSIFLIAPKISQAQTWEWAVGQTCGRTSPGDGMADGWLCNTDVYNNIYTGGIFSGGNRGDSVCFGGFQFYRSALTSNIILTKYDSAGNLIWTKLSDGEAMPYGLTSDHSGNLYLYGYFWSDSLFFGNYLITNPHYNISLGQNTSNNSSYFIIKFDTAGNVMWSRTGGNIAPVGYSLSFGDISSDASDNIYICGSFWDSSIQIGTYTLVNAHDTTTDIFVAKYDPSGNVIWAKSYGGIDDDLGIGISTRPDGYSYVTGTFKSANILFNTTTLTYAIGNAPAYNAPDMYVTLLDNSGNAVWARSSVGSAAPLAIRTDRTNNAYVVGTVYDSSTFTLGTLSLHNTRLSQSGFIAKYDVSGTIPWAKIYAPLKPYGSGGRNTMWGITTDPCNNVWVSGVSNGDSCYIDSTTVVHTTTGHPYSALFIGYTTSGNLLQYSLIPTVEDDNSGLASDSRGNIYLSDDVTGQAILGSINYYWGRGGEAMFLAKYRPNLECEKIDLGTKNSNSELTNIYPNPANNELTVISTKKITTITISDLLQQQVYSRQFNSEQVKVDITSLAKGMYIIIVNNLEVRKFLKE